MAQLTLAYDAHFIDIYIHKHTGKHQIGNSIQILLFTLPFLLRDGTTSLRLRTEVQCHYCAFQSQIHHCIHILIQR